MRGIYNIDDCSYKLSCQVAAYFFLSSCEGLAGKSKGNFLLFISEYTARVMRPMNALELENVFKSHVCTASLSLSNSKKSQPATRMLFWHWPLISTRREEGEFPQGSTSIIIMAEKQKKKKKKNGINSYMGSQIRTALKNLPVYF